MTFNSCSQGGQDAFAYQVCERKKKGTFLDVGSYNVVCCNNSYALERIGWRGLMVDLFRDDENMPQRKSPLVQANATNLDWLFQLKQAGLPEHLDYLSLDVDTDTLNTLAGIPSPDVAFGVITVEHDAYLHGDFPRSSMRRILDSRGYDLVCADVLIDGKPWEDWWCHPTRSHLADRFRCKQTEWRDIVKL